MIFYNYQQNLPDFETICTKILSVIQRLHLVFMGGHIFKAKNLFVDDFNSNNMKTKNNMETYI